MTNQRGFYPKTHEQHEHTAETHLCTWNEQTAWIFTQIIEEKNAGLCIFMSIMCYWKY